MNMSTPDLPKFLDDKDRTTAVVTAFVSRNPASATELPNLIQNVMRAFTGVPARQPIEIQEPALAQSEPVDEAPVEEEEEETVIQIRPAVPIDQSVHDDYIICLEDGKKFKSLKRHLRTKYNLSPEEYKEKWGLPHDYPMTAPAYSEQRAELARKMGLGRKRKDLPKKSVRVKTMAAPTHHDEDDETED